MVRDQLIPRLLSVTEAAGVLDCSRQHVNQLINDGKLPAATAGTTFVLAEETVRRYQAGERFPQPTELVIRVYDQDSDEWTVANRKLVAPDFVMPARFEAGAIGVADGLVFRVDLLDNRGTPMAVVHSAQP